MEQKISHRDWAMCCNYVGLLLGIIVCILCLSSTSIYFILYFLDGCSTIGMGSYLCALSLQGLCWHHYLFFFLCSVLCDVAHVQPVIFFFLSEAFICAALLHISFSIILCICTIIVLKNATLIHLFGR